MAVFYSGGQWEVINDKTGEVMQRFARNEQTQCREAARNSGQSDRDILWPDLDRLRRRYQSN